MADSALLKAKTVKRSYGEFRLNSKLQKSEAK
jgi:hypothetical protein